MEAPTVRLKNLNEIKGLENFSDYAIDVDGNVWSFKYNKMKKLRPGWAKKRGNYLFVRLSDSKGNKRNLYVHRLVAMAYLPCNDFTLEVNHINRNQCDNRIENLEWISRKQNMEHLSQTKGFVLDNYVTNKIKEVHAASHRKGLPVPNSYEFTNSIIEGALEQYINQYGLRKVMNTLPHP
jgi:hypothetical protein